MSLLLIAIVAATLQVQSYGAKCDGVTDDTVALQRAITVADTAPYRTILLPPSSCLFSSTLIFGNRTDRYSEISVIGHSEYTSTLIYTGPIDRSAMLISHMSAFHWQFFSVQKASYASGPRGTSVGIQLDGPFGTGGTMNTTITFNHVAIAGFHIGMLAGNGDAASELECRQCGFNWNDIGFTSSGYNSLNFWFYDVHLGQNIIGIQAGGPWVSVGVHVVGGDSSQNTKADFWCGNTFDPLSIQDFRAQIPSSGLFLGGECFIVTLRNSSIGGTSHTIPVINLPSVQSLTLEDDVITGQISVPVVGQFGTFIKMHNNTRLDEGTPTFPLILPVAGSGKVFLDLSLNSPNVNSPLGFRFADFHGVY